MYSNIAIQREIYGSEEHQMVRQALVDFLNKEAIPQLEQWEKGKAAPKSFWKKMGDQGFLCLDIPEQYGGSGFDYSFSALVQETTRTLGIDFGLGVHSDIVAPYILRYGNEDQKQTYQKVMLF